MQKITKTIFTVLIATVILPLSSYVAFAQFPFNIGVTGDTKTSGQGIATDASGNVYVTGEFNGTADFDPSSGTHNMTSTSSGGDMYVAKYDASGAFVWSLRIGNGNAAASSLKGIATDKAGNVYVTGSFNGDGNGDAFFYDVNNTNVGSLTTDGGSDVFVVKYDASGTMLWKVRIGSPGTDVGVACTTDASNNVLVTGSFNSTATFYDTNETATAHTLVSAGSSDAFVAKYDASGTYQWSLRGSSTQLDVVNAVATDATGNVYVTGSYGSAGLSPGTPITFVDAVGTSSTTLTNSGVATDLFVAKFDASGGYKWIFKMGGMTAEVGSGIAVDASGNIYISGRFGQTPFTLYDATGSNLGGLANTTGNDVFLAKYSSAGFYKWAVRIGGSSGDGGGTLALESDGTIAVTGSCQGNCYFYSFGTNTKDSAVTAYTDNIFVARYDTSGKFKCGFAIGSADGANNLNMGNRIAADGSGNIYVIGNFSDKADFDPGAGTANLTSKGKNTDPNVHTDYDAFISKYTACALNTGGGCLAHAGSNQAVCAGGNNSAVIGAAAISGHTYSWSPSTGLSSSTVAQPTATPGTTTTYTLTETVTATSCQATATVVVFVGTQPSTPVISPSGSTSICSGENVTLNATGSGYTAYLWSTGSTAQNITVSIQGSYSVTVSNSSGCSAVSSATSVTVNPLPAASAGTNKVTCPGVGVSIGAVAVNGSTYNWSPSTGLSSSTISQPIAAPSLTTTYTVTETVTATGCHASHSVVVLAYTAPSPVISPSGPTTFCAGGNVTLDAGAGYTTYVWSNGNSTQSTTVNSQGSYSVTVTNGSGCAGSTSATVTVNPVPATPVITQSNDTIFCSVTASSYQWYRNDTLISGATGKFYHPTQNGNYKVTVTDAGCSATSSAFNYIGGGVSSVALANSSVIIYPMPAYSYFIAESKTAALQSVALYDILGKRVLSADIRDVNTGIDNKKAKINLQGLPAGVYFVQLKTTNATSTLKLVKE